jgi:signal transduction histidine kinase
MTVVFAGFVALATTTAMIAGLGAFSGVQFESSHRMAAFGFMLAISFAIVGSYAAALQRGVRKESEAAQERARSDLERAQLRFVNRLSASLRDPLTGIVGFTQLLRDIEEGVASELTANECMSMILHDSSEISRNLDDFLVTAQLDVAAHAVVPIDTSIERLVGEVVRSEAVLGRRIAMDASAAIGYLDPDAFRHVVRNLVSNALLHGRAPVGVTGRIRDLDYVVTVTDRGDGLPPWVDEESLHVADVDDSFTRNGLGLSVALRLVARMGGRLSYRRQSGETAFEFSVPLSVASAHYRYKSENRFIRESLARLGLLESVKRRPHAEADDNGVLIAQ